MAAEGVFPASLVPTQCHLLNSGPAIRAPQPCDHPVWEGIRLHSSPQGPHRQSNLLGLQFGLTAPQKQRPHPGKEDRAPVAQMDCSEQVGRPARAVSKLAGRARAVCTLLRACFACFVLFAFACWSLVLFCLRNNISWPPTL